jgi:hypothetical protein
MGIGMRLMYDSTTAANIPADAAIVGGYVDGAYRWSDADWARFPNAIKVRIATRPATNDGHVGDVERGNMTATQAVDWVRMRRGEGADPTIYCSASPWPSVRAAFQDAVEKEPHYWIADYDRDPTIPVGAVAKQYESPKTGSGGHYDLSNVADFWPGVEDDVGFDQVIGTRQDGSAITAAEALVNLYLGAFYGGGDSGPHAVYPTVNKIADKVGANAAEFSPAVDPAGESTET